jgi:transcriptional regulator with XRE-family HTH domain
VRLLDPARVRRAVGRRVAELRVETGLTQEQLAEKLDVSLKYIQRIERGDENLTIDSLVKLGNQMKASPGAFFLAPAATGPRQSGTRPAPVPAPPKRRSNRSAG